MLGRMTCYVPACTGWKTQQAVPQDVVAKHPKAIKGTRRDGTRIELTSPSRGYPGSSAAPHPQEGPDRQHHHL